jgi:hypothetical protein
MITLRTYWGWALACLVLVSLDRDAFAQVFAGASGEQVEALAATRPTEGRSEQPLSGRWGSPAWVLTFDGSERRGTLVSFTPARLVLRIDGKDTTISSAEVRRVQVPASFESRTSTGLKAGAVTGLVAGVALTSGSSAGFRALIGLGSAAAGAIVGGGLGALVSRLKDGRQVLYDAAAATPTGPGLHVWIQTTDGQALEGTVVLFSPSVLELRRDSVVSRIPTTNIARAEIVRSPWPRMVKSAIVGGAVFGVLAFSVDLGPCATTGRATSCSPSIPASQRDSVGTPTKLTLIGAGALLGLGGGALTHRQRETVYSAEQSAAPLWTVQIRPQLVHGHVGLSAAVTWQW